MIEQVHIIDNKRVKMTPQEHQMYEALCREYDRPHSKGEELFKGHFETNSDGVILFVKPPNKRYTTLEVFCFLISIMNNQHMRINRRQTELLIKEATDKYKKLEQRFEKLLKEKK